LQITKKASSDYERMDTEMSVAPVPAAINENIQAVTPKNMVLNPE